MRKKQVQKNKYDSYTHVKKLTLKSGPGKDETYIFHFKPTFTA